MQAACNDTVLHAALLVLDLAMGAGPFGRLDDAQIVRSANRKPL